MKYHKVIMKTIIQMLFLMDEVGKHERTAQFASMEMLWVCFCFGFFLSPFSLLPMRLKVKLHPRSFLKNAKQNQGTKEAVGRGCTLQL